MRRPDRSEVRPTSHTASRAAVGRTSVTDCALGTRQVIHDHFGGFSAASLRRNSMVTTSSVGWSSMEVWGHVTAPGEALVITLANLSAKALTVGKRSCGLFERAFIRTRSRSCGSSGQTVVGSGGGSNTCRRSSASGDSAENGRRPVNSSKLVMPSAYWSVAGPVGPSVHCSGAMYAGVPRTRA